MLKIGDTVAEFTLPHQQGRPVSWSSLRGKPVVVFFYPKADTPGCTKEACGFRDMATEFGAAGAAVIGVSADSEKRQAAFSDKYDLNMPLLADPDHVILKPWGIWGEKKMYGKTSEGIIRTTVLFDGEGRVAEIWSPVRVDGHVDMVLRRVREG
jgi:thioredoxin-dependent peroxiredoxin